MTHSVPDDFPSNSSTSGILAVGSSMTGRFEHVYDSDWMKVDLVAGTPYVFSMSGQARWDFLSDFSSIYLELRGADGTRLWGESGYNQFGAVFEYTPKTSGTYFLASFNGETDPYKLGSYTLSASTRPAGPDDFANNASTTGTFELGGKVTGTFEFAGDIDWFKFRAEAGKYYSIGANVSAPFVYPSGMRILDSNGVEYHGFPFKPAVTGDYFFAISSYEAGQYSIVSRIYNDEYADDKSTTGVLRPGGEISGGIQFSNDVDYVKTTLAAGVGYTFELSGHANDVRGLKVSVWNADGKSFLISPTSTEDAKMPFTFTAPVAGDYFISISGEGLYFGVTRMPYTLKWVGPLATDDFGNDLASARQVALGATVNGLLDGKADIDVMKVFLQAGTSYTFVMNSGQEAAPVRMLITSDSGTQLFAPDVPRSAHTFTAQYSGNYYVSASTSLTAGLPFSFKSSVVTDDFGAAPSTAGKLVVGGSVSGSLTFGGGDRDWFSVTLMAGERYTFRTSGPVTTSDYRWPVGKVIDSAGNVVASSVSASGFSESIVDFSPTASGTYFFELYSERQSGNYTVDVARLVPDDFGNTGATAGRLVDKVWQSGAFNMRDDLDSFNFAATAGTQYVIEMRNDPRAQTTYLHVDDKANNLLQVRDVSAYTPGHKYYVVKAESTGDLLVTLDGNLNSGLDYAIKAYAVAADDFSDDRSTAGTVAINGQTKGAIEHWGDQDMFRVALSAGKSYVFELLGSGDNGGTLDTAKGASFTLTQANGAFVYSSYEHNQGWTRLFFTPHESADFYLEVNGASRNAGSYTVKATDVSGDKIAPKLIGQSLADGATGASLTGNIVLTFDESIRGRSGYLSLRDSSGISVKLSETVVNQSSTMSGNVLVLDPASTLKPGTSYTLELLQGNVADYAGNGYTGGKITFTTMPASSTGGAGNDLLAGLGRGSSIMGGAGVDTAVYSEAMAHYRVLRNNGDATVWLGNAPMGDALSGVERLLFTDGAIALDIGGTAGQAYRLYQAAFDRVPDKGGLGFWIAQMDNGMSLGAVASSFVSSDEFKSLYGTAPTDAQFVDLLYDNVLHRKGEQAGIDFWMNSLAVGVRRDDMLAQFSESAENQAALASIIGNGFIYHPYG